jgi:hypothetical protein
MTRPGVFILAGLAASAEAAACAVAACAVAIGVRTAQHTGINLGLSPGLVTG